MHMPAKLETQFHREMVLIYVKARDECNYNATRFLQMVNTQGGLAAAKSLLQTDNFSEGLTEFWKLGRLDISMEALILKDPWSALFTEAELKIARRRLQDLKYNYNV